MRLLDVVATLRSEKGCPWDKKQTLESLKQYAVEEAYEVIDAIDSKDPAKHADELGDLLLQVVLQCQLRSEQGEFTFDDVMDRLAKKLVHRHPHVFGDALKLHTPEEVLQNWEKAKAEEKRQRGESLLESIPRHLPALQKAHRVQSKVARVGFDWPDAKGVIRKIDEELAEFKAAVATDDKAGQAEEVGDLLFTLVNLCRFLDLSPEDALQATTAKFTRRFQRMETNMLKTQRPLDQLTPEEFDAAWKAVKDEERRT